MTYLRKVLFHIFRKHKRLKRNERCLIIFTVIRFHYNSTFLTFPADKLTFFLAHSRSMSLWMSNQSSKGDMSHTITNMISLMSQCVNVLHKSHVPCVNQTHMMLETSRSRQNLMRFSLPLYKDLLH